MSCEHKSQATTFLGALTGTGWTCRDRGQLVSEQPAPDMAEMNAAFDREMAGRQYGEEETRDARAWFAAGWKARPSW